MEDVLYGITGVKCINYDMPITGLSTGEHKNNLEKVLSKPQSFNLRVNSKKCDIFKDSVKFFDN